VSGVTNEKLKQLTFLEGATMPDGQKYEDWLKKKRAARRTERTDKGKRGAGA
jgi:hypothetical protein